MSGASLSVDVAVVGSGFGGSLTALVARRLGLSVALLERGTHPRFAIGESTSPLANLLLEELARRYELPRLLPLCKWGRWRRERPEVACGLKRGFSFYEHRADRRFAADPNRGDQLLVAATPRDEVADTHWYRPDFDFFLVCEARDAGAEYLDRAALDRVEIGDGGVRISGERAGERLEVRARLAVDASGPRRISLEDSRRRGAAVRRAARDVRPLHPLHGRAPPRRDERPALGTRRLPTRRTTPPSTTFSTAAGSGFCDSATASRARASRRAPPWPARCDSKRASRRGSACSIACRPCAEQFAGARPDRCPFVHRARLPFRAAQASGPGWTLLPSAAAFVDPLLSTGFPLTLLGIERLGRALEEDWGSPRLAPRLARDAERSLFETDAAALLVGALYATFDDFPLFAALSKLYFAAASFSEAARRLGRPEVAGSFLCADREPFGARMRDICRRAIASRGTDRPPLIDDVHCAIAPLDVAGLGRLDRRNWYPFRGEDLVENAEKVGATAGEARELLERCGLAEPSVAAR